MSEHTPENTPGHRPAEPVAPPVLEEDQSVPPRPEEELADGGRTESHDG